VIGELETGTEAKTEASRLKISSQVPKERVFRDVTLLSLVLAFVSTSKFDLPFEECDLPFEEIMTGVKTHVYSFKK
jgi:hypothetical protein